MEQRSQAPRAISYVEPTRLNQSRVLDLRVEGLLHIAILLLVIVLLLGG